MKKIDFKTRVQWDYFKSAIFGLAIGMLIAPGIKDIKNEYDSAEKGTQKSMKEKAEDVASSIMNHFAWGDKVKVIINGKVVAIAKSKEEGEESYKAARLAYNADGVKPIWVTAEYKPVNKEDESDKALLKEMKTLKGDELENEILASFDNYASKDKKLAYTMRIDDYTVTVEHFEDVVSVLEDAQSAYDDNNEFQVGLKSPESKNVTMYEVEVARKLEDGERVMPDKLESGEQTGDGEPESDDENGEGTGNSSEDTGNAADIGVNGEEKIIPRYIKTALTEGQSESGSVDNEGDSSSDTAVAGEDNAESQEGGTSDNEGNADSNEDSTGENDAADTNNSEDAATDDETENDAAESVAGDGAAETDAEKNPAVAEAEEKLSAEDGVKYVGFSDRISVVETYVNASQIEDRDTVYNEVTTPVDEAGVYVVVPGDCLSIIAEKVGMSEDRIKELNEGIENDDDIYYDDRLNIVVPTPPVEVMVEKQETYTENYYADVEYQDDDSMFIGETSVIQEGTPGTHTVTDLITYKGNIESDRKQIDEVVEVAAVPEIVLRGTKSQPTYMFPVTNWNVTSNFGYRWGRLHAGTDVGVPQGTTVRASRGGQVITAGWVGGYGNCVIIDHGDGVATRYGHLSEVLVSVGQYVDQGDQIALSGNTGRSTGPHLHFEIRINGEAVDPLPYLYQTQ